MIVFDLFSETSKANFYDKVGAEGSLRSGKDAKRYKKLKESANS